MAIYNSTENKKLLISYIRTAAVPLFAGSLVLSACTGPVVEKPNVIIIITDDQGYGDMSCTGNPILTTPNLDMLCSQSIHFTDFHVSPYCSPTRASLMTGRDARRTCVWHTAGGRNLLAEDETTLAEVFKFNGYATGHFGKWHLGVNYPFAPHFRGFDISLMLGNGGLGANDDYWGNDRFDDTYFQNGKPVKTHGYGTDVFVDHALEFIEMHKKEPFFVYLATNIPHRPWNVPARYSRKYAPKGTEKPEIVPYAHSDMALFYGCIDKIDEQVGRILAYLEKEGLDKNTILMFLTDNGTVSTDEYNAGMRGRKGTPYEGGHRVPLFIRWPEGKFISQPEINELTAHIDIFPTRIDLCGMKTGKQISFDGQSLAPLLYNKHSRWNNERIYFTQSTQRVEGGYHVNVPKWGNTAVCKEKWRLVNDELYDLRNDPGQENDLAEHYPDIGSELKAAYEKYWEDIHPFTEKTVRIRVGNPEHPVTSLSHMNFTPLQGGQTSWSMASVVDAYVADVEGKWHLYLEQSGDYEVELRRWPREVDQSINAFKELGCSVPSREFMENAVQISPDSARVKAGNVDTIKKIDPDLPSVNFRVTLSLGPADLQALFIDRDGTKRPAYFVYVKKLSPL